MTITVGAEFAALLIHDIAEPLRRMRLHAELLEDAVNLKAFDEQKHLVAAIQRDAATAGGMAEAACQAMLGKSGRLDAQRIRNIVVEPAEQPEGYTLSWRDPLPVMASPVEFAYALRTLVRNAIKHHDRPMGTIEISHVAPWFHVSDDGPGCGPDPVTSGLGLRLVEQLVSRVGGRMTIAPTGARGTRVSFTWPLRRDCREADGHSLAARSASHDADARQ